MLDKFLKEAVSSVVGKSAESIAELLNSKKHVNEFLISKKMDITINQTRNLLYRMADKGLVSSIRKKDKKKGWYTYFWKIEILKTLNYLKDLVEKRRKLIEEQIKNRETKQYYVCERCNLEFDEAQALLMNFVCNECGEVFTLEDNTKLLKDLSRNLERHKKTLGEIDAELGKEQAKLDKVRDKEIEKKKEEKRVARKKAAVKRAADKKREENKNKKSSPKSLKQKKTIKKKVVKKVVKKKSTKAKKAIKKKVVKKKAPKKKASGEKTIKKNKSSKKR